MITLQELLGRLRKFQQLEDELEKTYNESGLPRGRAYTKKKAFYQNGKNQIMSKVSTYGEGHIWELTLVDGLGNPHKILLNIPESDIPYFMELRRPGYSLINKTKIKLNKAQ